MSVNFVIYKEKSIIKYSNGKNENKMCKKTTNEEIDHKENYIKK